MGGEQSPPFLMYTHVRHDKDMVHVPVVLRCRVTVDRGLFTKQYRGVKVNDIGVLWPESHFREKAITGAKMWIQQMEQQGYSLLSSESDIAVWGPYKPRNFTGAQQRSWRPAPGMGSTFRTFGERSDEDPFEDSADFVLEARFLASKQRMVEHSVRTPEEN